MWLWITLGFAILHIQLLAASYESDIFHFPVRYLEGLTSAEEMALGRMEHARSEALSDAARVSLPPPWHPWLPLSPP